MKRIGNVVARIAEYANVLYAFSRAIKGKRNRRTARRFQGELTKNLNQIGRQLRNGIWSPDGYHRFVIHDPKQRVIHAASFRDRATFAGKQWLGISRLSHQAEGDFSVKAVEKTLPFPFPRVGG